MSYIFTFILFGLLLPAFAEGTEKCGNNRGIIIEIGPKIEGKSLIRICYSEEIGGTLYSEHILNGSSNYYCRSAGSRPNFNDSRLASGVNKESYEKNKEEETFRKLLKLTKTSAEVYINSKSFLAKGHLTPDADMKYVSCQSYTYFLINTVPQWQQINNGNWKSLETSLRNVTEELKQNFQVFTGTHKVLQLPDINNNFVEITLSNGKLPVPKFIWKVFYNILTKEAIAFVNLNNPFVNGTTEDMYLCPDICNQYGWGTESWTHPEKGLLYCCEVDALRQAVSHVPYLPVSGNMSHPRAHQKGKRGHLLTPGFSQISKRRHNI